MRTTGWLICASLVSLALGLANLFKPGSGLHMVASETDAQTGLKTSALNMKDFITHVFPSNFIDAIAHNEILQILVFSLFFGIALAALRHYTRVKALIDAIEGMVATMLHVTDYVMWGALLGVFAAIASVVTAQGATSYRCTSN